MLLIEGDSLVNLIRYSWWDLDKSAKECGIEKSEVFSLTAGPVALCFSSGIILGAASDPSKASVIIWLEKDSNGKSQREEPMEEDEELFPISLQGQHESWGKLLGHKLKSYEIIRRKPVNAKIAELPREVGLLFTLDNGDEFILSHGLHDNSDDFSVIRREQITKELQPQLIRACSVETKSSQ